MNLIQNKLDSLNNWVETTPPNRIVDYITYDQYEINNPFRHKIYDTRKIDNKFLRATADIAKNTGAEVVSAYINPFYLTHKIVNMPISYQEIVNTYEKYKLTQ